MLSMAVLIRNVESVGFAETGGKLRSMLAELPTAGTGLPTTSGGAPDGTSPPRVIVTSIYVVVAGSPGLGDTSAACHPEPEATYISVILYPHWHADGGPSRKLTPITVSGSLFAMHWFRQSLKLTAPSIELSIRFSRDDSARLTMRKMMVLSKT